VLLVSAVIVQARDLQQVIPVVLPLAMIVSVLKPLTQESHHHLNAVFIHGWERIAYCIVNPMAPIMTASRDSILIGIGPQWGILGWALLGSVVYMVLGYKVFKRLEVNFADLT
jgi:ABC-type polysaccharide/polyol phosphate export permease